MKPGHFVFDHLLNLGILSLLVLAPCASSAAAVETTLNQNSNAAVARFPLLLPDTSSPRDTLRSFLANVKMAAEARRRGTQDVAGVRAWMRALMAPEFDTSPDSDSWSVRTESALLLKEILDRVEVPSESKAWAWVKPLAEPVSLAHLHFYDWRTGP